MKYKTRLHEKNFFIVFMLNKMMLHEKTMQIAFC